MFYRVALHRVSPDVQACHTEVNNNNIHNLILPPTSSVLKCNWKLIIVCQDCRNQRLPDQDVEPQ
uniref:Uncharacterized protein n=1 Tax=Arundo donax TaxID=35708 RepID=A0A0A9FEJ1_ARUDO